VTPVHRLSASELAALASGRGGACLVHALRRAQLSKRLLLLKFIAQAWPGDRTERDRALEVLAAAQRRAPEAFAEALGYPSVGIWAARIAVRLRDRSGIALDADLGHLGAVAAAAAVRAGLDAELVAPVRAGGVAIPSVGRVRLPLPEHTPARVIVRDGRLVVHDGLRRLAAGAGATRLSVALDDLDPYRDVHHVPAADRLPDAELPAWQELFRQAWTLLVRYAPERVEELAAGLRSLVPLAQPDAAASRSATVRDAFGMFGLTRPESAVDFAVTLVHEFQHSKLSALLDVVPLYRDEGEATYYAPWRRDPRPIGGLLQGVYAFLGVADLWRVLRGCAHLRELATIRFAEVREQVRCALAGLDRATCLTPAGRRFVAGMRCAVDALLAEPVPAGVVRRARAALDANYQTWLRTNGPHLAGVGVSSETL
jgi:HEXXH motif-containing protein